MLTLEPRTDGAYGVGAECAALQFAHLRVLRANSTCVLDVIALGERFRFPNCGPFHSSNDDGRRACGLHFLTASTDGSLALFLSDSSVVERHSLLKCAVNSIDALALHNQSTTSSPQRWLLACAGDDGLVHCALLSVPVNSEGEDDSSCGAGGSKSCTLTPSEGSCDAGGSKSCALTSASTRLTSLFSSPLNESHACAVVGVRFLVARDGDVPVARANTAAAEAEAEASVMLVSASSDMQVIVWRLRLFGTDDDGLVPRVRAGGRGNQLTAAGGVLEPLQRARFAVRDAHSARLMRSPFCSIGVAARPVAAAAVSASSSSRRAPAVAELGGGECDWHILIGGCGLELLRIRVNVSNATPE